MSEGTALAILAALRAGTRPASGVLHTCRLHAFGSEVYGIDAIVERFRTCPVTAIAADWRSVIAPGHVAAFVHDEVIIADMAGDNVARLWRIGSGTPAPSEPGIAVVFDPDCHQAGGDLFASASDHRALSGEAFDRVAIIGRDLARSDAGYRAGAFVVRAFGTPREGAALFALHCASKDEARAPGFVHVAAHWRDDEVMTVRDSAGDAALAASPWTPRVPE